MSGRRNNWANQDINFQKIIERKIGLHLQQSMNNNHNSTTFNSNIFPIIGNIQSDPTQIIQQKLYSDQQNQLNSLISALESKSHLNQNKYSFQNSWKSKYPIQQPSYDDFIKFIKEMEILARENPNFFQEEMQRRNPKFYGCNYPIPFPVSYAMRIYYPNSIPLHPLGVAPNKFEPKNNIEVDEHSNKGATDLSNPFYISEEDKSQNQKFSSEISVVQNELHKKEQEIINLKKEQEEKDKKHKQELEELQKKSDLILQCEVTPDKIFEAENFKKEIEISQKKIKKDLEIGKVKEQISDINKTLQEKYFCPITHAVFTDPVLADDGFTYERQYIEDWLKGSDFSPMTNEKLTTKSIISNRHVKNLISDLNETKASLEEKLKEMLKEN